MNKLTIGQLLDIQSKMTTVVSGYDGVRSWRLEYNRDITQIVMEKYGEEKVMAFTQFNTDEGRKAIVDKWNDYVESYSIEVHAHYSF